MIQRAATLAVITVPALPDGPVSVLIGSTGVQIYGAGEWQQEKHGKRARCTWRKLHLAIDATSGQIVASTLTEANVDDPSQVARYSIRSPQRLCRSRRTAHTTANRPT